MKFLKRKVVVILTKESTFSKCEHEQTYFKSDKIVELANK